MGIAIVVNEVHAKNAVAPIVASCETPGNVTVPSWVHVSNAKSPIIVTEAGIAIVPNTAH